MLTFSLLYYVFQATKSIFQTGWFIESLATQVLVIHIIRSRRNFLKSRASYWLTLSTLGVVCMGFILPFTPLGRDTFELSRNYYDRLGHLAQGFVPAIIAREILLRKSPLQPGKWLAFIVICICLAISATYELIEFGVALLSGEAADAFLGTQGDVWDTQWDMLFALTGSVTALISLTGYHDRLLAQYMIRK